MDRLPSDWQVPTYTITHFHPKRHPYAVCIFVINEGARVQRQLTKMAHLADQVDIIIADGGSTDGSLQADFLQANNVSTLLTKTGQGKLSAQMRMAFAYCMLQDYDGVITIDGNDKDDTSAIPAFIRKLQAGYDHLQGSRFIPGGKAINTPSARYWGVRLLHAPLISFAAKFRYTDTTNGFRGYSKKLLLDPRVAPFRDVFQAYELHYYLAIRAARLGYRIGEIPVTRAYPKGEKTPTKIKGWRGNLFVLKTLFRSCFLGYNPERKKTTT